MRKTNIVLLVIGILAIQAKDPLQAPGDVNVENLLNVNTLNMPELSSLSCSTAELSTVSSKSLIASYITSDTVSVTDIIAKDSDIKLYGKIKITGSVSYSSDLQLSMKEKQSVFPISLSFLQIPIKQWREIDVFRIANHELIVEDLPTHEFLLIVGNCHCEENEVLMKVDGTVEWMQSCLGTNHIQSVIDHQERSVRIQFEGSEKTDPVIIFIK